MGFSYEGIGAWCASFACAEIEKGEVVKLSGNAEVSACASGDAFCGVVRSVGHDGAACSVQLHGMATVSCSGASMPAAGFCKLSADGNGGVCVSTGGKEYLVVDADPTAKTVTIRL